jgi:hypothetical protein
MWKNCAFFFLFLSSATSFSQNVFPTTGNAGIGTTTPLAPIHIVGYDWDKIMLEEIGTNSLGRIQFKNSGNTLYLGTVGSSFINMGHVRPNASFFTYDGATGIHFAAVHFNASIRLYTGGGDNIHERLRVDSIGRFFLNNISRTSVLRDSIVSINPLTNELQVSPLRSSQIQFTDTRAVSTNPTDYNLSFVTQLKNNATIGLTSEGSGLNSLIGFRGGAADATGKSHELAFTDNNNVWVRSGFNASWGAWRKLILDSAGVVRLGTTSNRATLHVNGDIFSRKVKVTQNNWPDFVFEDNYKLMPLDQLELFITRFKHLPDIPSASEVHADGIELGDNQAALLRKIEELTLYTIHQQKLIEKQASEIEQIKKQLDKLSKSTH